MPSSSAPQPAQPRQAPVWRAHRVAIGTKYQPTRAAAQKRPRSYARCAPFRNSSRVSIDAPEEVAQSQENALLALARFGARRAVRHAASAEPECLAILRGEATHDLLERARQFLLEKRTFRRGRRVEVIFER